MDLKRVTVLPAGMSLEMRPQRPILAEMERLGYTIRHGCRRGGCGLCKVDVVSGSVRHEARSHSPC